MARTKVQYRQIYEKAYKCCILPGYHIHHIDGNSHNNDYTNLEIVTPAEHIERHKALGHKILDKFIAKADWYTNLSLTEKASFKEKASMYGKLSKGCIVTTETKAKLKQSNKYRAHPIIMINLKDASIQEFTSIREASQVLKMQRAHILRVIHGHRKQYKGHIFKYKA